MHTSQSSRAARPCRAQVFDLFDVDISRARGRGEANLSESDATAVSLDEFIAAIPRTRGVPARCEAAQQVAELAQQRGRPPSSSIDLCGCSQCSWESRVHAQRHPA